MRISIPLAIGLMLATQAPAQTASPAPTPDAAPPAMQAAAPAAPPKRVRVICVRSQADTGSHFGARKECHTEDEWAMIHGETTFTMDQFREQQNRTPQVNGR